MFWMKPAVYHIRYGYIVIPQDNTLACSSETPHSRVLLTRRVFYHCFNTFSVCCNDLLTCCWVSVACCLKLVCYYNTLRRVLLEKQHTDVSWLQKAKFLEHVGVSYKHVCVLKQHANDTSWFLMYLSRMFKTTIYSCLRGTSILVLELKKRSPNGKRLSQKVVRLWIWKMTFWERKLKKR